MRGMRSRSSRLSQPYDSAVTIQNNRKVYVINLAWDVKWSDLKDHMRQAGNVIRADVIEDRTGRSQGRGIVEYETPEEAANAIATLDGSDLMGRPIQVREDREPDRELGAPRAQPSGGAGTPPPYHPPTVPRVYVGNLSWDVKWQDLKDHFKAAGNVIRADVMEESPGRSKGCGIVEFSTLEEADQAIRTLNETDLMGRVIFVREDRETSRGVGFVPGSTFAPTGGYPSPRGYPGAGFQGAGFRRGPGTSPYEAPSPYPPQSRHPYPPPPSHLYPPRGTYPPHPSQYPPHSSPYPQHPHHPHSQGTHSPVPPINTNRLYVNNLAWDVNWRNLKDHFKQAGNVLHADVTVDAEGRSKGYGFVEFASPQEAHYAIAMLNETPINGRPIYVREDREPPPPRV